MTKTLTILTLLLLAVDPRDIGKINEAKTRAKEAYQAGNYQEAADAYRYLVDSVGVDEDEVRLNLASSYFNLNDTANAISSYQPLTMSLNNKIKSLANQQIGVLNNREGKFEEALQYLKQAIKADPSNDDAKYNYEMIKKKLEEQKKKEQQQNQDKNKQDQEKKDQEQKEQKDKQQNADDKKDQQQSDQDKKDQEKKDQEKKDPSKDEQQKDEEKQDKEQQMPPSVKDKLKDMDMSEEKAKMILEAMKNQEIQYLQQNKRKATKRKDPNKPDW